MNELDNVPTIAQEGENAQQEQNQVADNTNVEQQTEAVTEPFLKVKYNHEERGLTADEAREYAQKGINYDKVFEENQSLKNRQELAFVENLAKEYGMTAEQYIEAVHAEREANKIRATAENYQIPEEVAKKLYESEQYITRVESEKQQTQAQMQEQERQNADAREFLQEFPSVDVNSIPQEVWDNVQKGKSLVDAYARHEAKELRTKMQIASTNQVNANSATGSITGNGQAIEKDFYTKAEVSLMSQSEVNKNLDKIKASMKKW